jgi:formiminotetrahydrofolate cyclodeaminase
MVARLTIGKKRYAEHEETMKRVENTLEGLQGELFDLVSEDARAYDAFVAARKMSQRTPEEVESRAKASAEAARNAALVPMRTAETCVRVLAELVTVATNGNENAASDAGVAAWLARSGVEGGALNVAINLPELGEADRADLEKRSARARREAAELHRTCVEAVERRIQASMASS